MNGRQWLRWLVVLGCLVCLPVKSYALLETMSAVLQNTVSDAAAGSDMNVTGYNTVLVEVTITGSATITFRGSGAGSAYTDLACVNITSTTGITTTTATATGIYRCSVAGLNIFRVPITTYSSGTVRAFARVTTGGGGGGSGGSGGTYVASPPTLTDGESAALLLDSSGRIVMSLGTCLSGESACIGTSPDSYIQTRSLPYATYTASNTWTPPATPSDLVTITGSATKTVKVWSIKIGTTNTAAGSQQFFLIKRSAADTGGTPVAGTAVPVDSNNDVATATVNHYTADPGALGAAVGTINTVRAASTAAVPASFAGVRETAQIELLPMIGNAVQPVVLRGIAEQLAINFNDVALVSGQTHTYTIVWSEE